MFYFTFIKKSYIEKLILIGIFFSICVEGNEIIIHPESAKVSFDVTHIGKTTVYGSFKSFDGIIFVKDNRFIKAQGKIYIDSIETNNKVRNAYLKSKKFFDSASFPYIYFFSDSFKLINDGLISNGQLNIYGITQNIEIKFIHDKDKNQLSSKTAINRFDFNLHRHKRMIGATVNIQLLLNLPKNISLNK